MKREQVNVVVEQVAIGDKQGRKLAIRVNGELMGKCQAALGIPIVPQALVLVGYSTVKVSGVGWRPSTTELWHVRKAAQEAGEYVSPKLNGSRGVIELKKFHVVGMDECMLDVFYNGIGTWKWATPYLDSIEALETILQEAPFDVEVQHVVPVSVATVLKAA